MKTLLDVFRKARLVLSLFTVVAGYGRECDRNGPSVWSLVHGSCRSFHGCVSCEQLCPWAGRTSWKQLLGSTIPSPWDHDSRCVQFSGLVSQLFGIQNWNRYGRGRKNQFEMMSCIGKKRMSTSGVEGGTDKPFCLQHNNKYSVGGGSHDNSSSSLLGKQPGFQRQRFHPLQIQEATNKTENVLLLHPSDTTRPYGWCFGFPNNIQTASRSGEWAYSIISVCGCAPKWHNLLYFRHHISKKVLICSNGNLCKATPHGNVSLKFKRLVAPLLPPRSSDCYKGVCMKEKHIELMETVEASQAFNEALAHMPDWHHPQANLNLML